MRISVLTIGAIASILTINSVFATTSTVTSKDYVDAADALKQNKIPATGTNASTPGSTVVTYTGTAGTIGERGICNDPTDNCNQADIATYGLVGNAVEYIQDNMPRTTVAYKTCTEWVVGMPHSDNNCLLWDFGNKVVNGGCIDNAGCPGRCQMCVDGACVNNPNCAA